jgi:apolipoprotein N-acyltransferase
MLPVVSLVLAAAAANLALRPPPAPAGWVAIDTQFGRFPTDRHAAFRRQNDLMKIAAEAIEGGAKVVILPEEVAGTWRTAVQYWWRPIDELAARHGATVLVGADVPVSPGSFEAAAPRFTNSLVALGSTQGRVDARVPIPVSLWRPWSQKGAVADIEGRGIIELHGVRAAVSICYEDFLAWPLLVSFAHAPQPQAIISSANNWFHEGQRQLWVQRRSSELGARLFGVPLLRAINTMA